MATPEPAPLKKTSGPSAWVNIQRALDYTWVDAMNTRRTLRNQAIRTMNTWGKKR